MQEQWVKSVIFWVKKSEKSQYLFGKIKTMFKFATL